MWNTINSCSITTYIDNTKEERMDSPKTKNHKLARVIQAKTPMSNCRVPIINLSDYKLSEVECKNFS